MDYDISVRIQVSQCGYCNSMWILGYQCGASDSSVNPDNPGNSVWILPFQCEYWEFNVVPGIAIQRLLTVLMPTLTKFCFHRRKVQCDNVDLGISV